MPNSQSDAPQIDAAKMMIDDTEKRLNIGAEHILKLPDVIAILREVHLLGFPRYPVLAILFTGAGAPPDCIPMKREPIPPSGFSFNNDFPDRLRSALKINEAIHDGAVAFGRAVETDQYTCIGWSYLISAKTIVDSTDCNRGAAYNSGMFLSATLGIDCVALFSAAELEVFVKGNRFVKFVNGQRL